jgi:subtilisin family serine protease
MYARIALLLTALIAAPIDAGAGGSPVVPGRLIVKYRPSVDACAHCLLAHGKPFAGVTGRSSLDELHQALGVRGARALFFEHHTQRRGRAAAWASRMDTVRASFPLRAARSRHAGLPDLSRVYVLDLPPDTDVAAAAARYAADPDVEWAEPDRVAQLAFVPNDPFYSSSGSWGQAYRDLYGMVVTQASTAWDTANGTGTVVAVVDTGVDETHPDIAANMWTNPGEIPGNGIDDDDNGFVDDLHGWDFTEDDATPHDFYGHGTHVAGTIAAIGNNGLGVIGMAWGARVMPLRGFDAVGFGTNEWLSAGVVYAAENGADVISNSWGSYGISQVVTDATATALGLGAVMVAAAGNDHTYVNEFVPAGLPGVIAVSATDYQDHLAGFSNFGEEISVAGPGVDVLSLRAGVIPPGIPVVVGTDYVRFSGTSMATPHVSGVAALLLEAQPALTPDEVRWHLELNADQPGFPGYEGAPWNPYFGWGRINAARVFDPVPATTRTRPRAIGVHAYAGRNNADLFSADLEFTTLTPESWTLGSSPWLVPSSSAGSGPDHLVFSLDATAMVPGPVTGSIVVTAPGTVDGGATLPVTAELHSDPGTSGPITVAAGTETDSDLHVATDGVGTMVFWIANDRIFGARIDGGTGVSPPVDLVPGPGVPPDPVQRDRVSLDVTTDGRDFLLGWVDVQGETWSMQTIRVGPDGQALDAGPTVVDTRRFPPFRGLLYRPRLAADGAGYVVLWDEFRDDGFSRIYLRRMGRDGTLRSKRRKIYPGAGTTPRFIQPSVACVNDSCLVAWKDGTQTNAPVHALRVVGDRASANAPLLLQNANDLADIHSDGTGYALLAQRVHVCPPSTCGYEILGLRVDAAGLAQSPDGTRLDVDPPTGYPLAQPAQLTHDGTNWIATALFDHQIFGMRMTPAGAAVETEPVGTLLSPTTTAGSASIAVTRTDSVVVWRESDLGSTIRAQRALPHSPSGPAFAAVAIGTIGNRNVAERSVLGLEISAPGLNPATTTFTAANLPLGAVFDPPTHTFRWVPGADQAGSYPGVHFEADDGVSTVSEDVTMVVTEAVHSISGTVTLAGGGPAPLVGLRLTGGLKRVVFTDAAGHYHFDDLAPRLYRLKLESSRAYLATPRAVSVVVSTSDVHGVDLMVTPR